MSPKSSDSIELINISRYIVKRLTYELSGRFEEVERSGARRTGPVDCIVSCGFETMVAIAMPHEGACR